MTVELKVPESGESVTEAEIAEWLKSEGDTIQVDEVVVVVETEKITLEVASPVNGTLKEILKQAGEFAEPGEVVGYIDENGASPSEVVKEKEEDRTASGNGDEEKKEQVEATETEKSKKKDKRIKKEVSEGKQGEKIMASLSPQEERERPEGGPEEINTEVPKQERVEADETSNRREEVVPMSLLRRTIAKRLVEAQNTGALLTTFNEIDMSECMALREAHGQTFQKRYETKLGLMSFFVKASVDALKQFPQLNAIIRDENIVYRNYHDIGVAIGSGKGLLVPVLRNADQMSFAEIERAISDFAKRAETGDLEMEDLSGGTFTISNGGIYGSLLSTPIVNPPQSGLLGLHAIQERPVADHGEVVIRHMMYVALTYDHRLVDGREAVTFLNRVREVIEQPARIFLEV